MDNKAFEYLYLHANSIATLGFLRGMARLIAMPLPTEPTPGMIAFAEAIEHQMQHPETFNWSAFEGMDQDADEATRRREEAIASGLPFFDQQVVMTEDDEEEGEMPDIARYLARAQAALVPLAPRIIESFARVDHVALAAALATLPADLPPLTAALSPAGLERWIELYESNHEGLCKVVEETRRPEPAL